MNLFSSAVQAFKLAARASRHRALLPRSLKTILNRLELDESNTSLKNDLVDALFKLKRETYYYHLCKKLPSLYAFERALTHNIETHLSHLELNHLSSEELLLGTRLSPAEIKLCTIYYLMKANLWNLENEARITDHLEPYAILKSMALLHQHHLLTQTNFNFITTPIDDTAAKAQDITCAIATLQYKDWLNANMIEQLGINYKLGLGRIFMILASSEFGVYRHTYKLLAPISHALETKALDPQLSLFSHANLLLCSSRSSYTTFGDYVYFPIATDAKMLKEIRMALMNKDARSIAQFTEQGTYKNKFNKDHYHQILSMTKPVIEKLSTELSALKTALSLSIFSPIYIDRLLISTARTDFTSRAPIIILLEKMNALDPHIIYAIYHAQNNNIEQILANINELLPLLHPNYYKSIIRYYFKHNAPDLRGLMSFFPEESRSQSLILSLIPSTSRKIIENLSKQHPHLLTSAFLYHLQYLTFIQNIKVIFNLSLPVSSSSNLSDIEDTTMEAKLEVTNPKIFISQLSADELILLGNHSKFKEIIRLINKLNQPTHRLLQALLHLNPLILQSIDQIFTKLEEAHLMEECFLRKLIDYMLVYLQKNVTPNRVELIVIIKLLPAGILDAKIFFHLIRDPDIQLIKNILRNPDHKEACIELLKAQVSGKEIYGNFHSNTHSALSLWSQKEKTKQIVTEESVALII